MSFTFNENIDRAIDAFESLFNACHQGALLDELNFANKNAKAFLPLARSYLLGYFDFENEELRRHKWNHPKKIYRIDLDNEFSFVLDKNKVNVQFAVYSQAQRNNPLIAEKNQNNAISLIKSRRDALFIMFDFSGRTSKKEAVGILNKYREIPSLGKGNHYKSGYTIIYFYIDEDGNIQKQRKEIDVTQKSSQQISQSKEEWQRDRAAELELERELIQSLKDDPDHKEAYELFTQDIEKEAALKALPLKENLFKNLSETVYSARGMEYDLKTGNAIYDYYDCSVRLKDGTLNIEYQNKDDPDYYMLEGKEIEANSNVYRLSSNEPRVSYAKVTVIFDEENNAIVEIAGEITIDNEKYELVIEDFFFKTLLDIAIKWYNSRSDEKWYEYKEMKEPERAYRALSEHFSRLGLFIEYPQIVELITFLVRTGWRNPR